MTFGSYIVSDTKTSLSMPLLGFETCHLPQKPKHSKSFKRFAFTLAETLITLTIIGVIAALTVPNLLNKYTKHTYVVGLKKAYSQLQNAWKMIPITEGCSAGDYDCAGISFEGRNYIQHNTELIPILAKQFKTTKIVSASEINKSDCILNQFCEYACTGYFTTKDGMKFSHHAFVLHVDVNGDKGPNKAGRDIFSFSIIKENNNNSTVVPSGLKMSSEIRTWESLCSTTSQVETWSSYDVPCTARVLLEDAMNY